MCNRYSLITRYTFLTDKAFRAHPVGSKGGAKAACCNWDLCNRSWETATLTEEQYAQVHNDPFLPITIFKVMIIRCRVRKSSSMGRQWRPLLLRASWDFFGFSYFFSSCSRAEGRAKQNLQSRSALWRRGRGKRQQRRKR